MPRPIPRALPLAALCATFLASPAGAAPEVKTAPPSAATSAAKPTPPPAPKPIVLPNRRPLVLDALHVEGRADAPRVLFVHAGPTVALEDAPAHPSYLRDDFTAALSSPVRVRVRAAGPRRQPTAGGNR